MKKEPFLSFVPHELFSKQELCTFTLMGDGIQSNETIGELMCLSPHTIKNHKENMKNKLGIDSCKELLLLAVKYKHQK